MCGEGITRLPITLRHQGKDVHYVGIDAVMHNLPSLYELTKTRPGFSAFSAAMSDAYRRGLPRSIIGGALFEAAQRLHEEYHQIKLDFNNPTELREQLKEAVGETKFDEVHFHMPPYGTKGHPESLGVIAEFMKPGGTLYHIFELSRPLLAGLEPSEARHEKLQAVAAKAGLTLMKHGILLNGRVLVTRSDENPDEEKRRKLNDYYSAVLAQYTSFPAYATNFAIMRKPLKRK